MKGTSKAVLAGLGVFLLGLALMGTQCQERGGSPAPQPSVSASQRSAQPLAPDFPLVPVTGGQAARLSDHRGKVVILNFFTTSCHFCNEEAPQLESLYQQYAGGGLEVLAVCFDSEDVAAVKSFVSRHHLTYPIFAKSPEAKGAYRITGFPTTVIIDREGKQRAAFPGLVRLDQLKAAVEPLVSATN